jgi:hypothetical protein
MLCWFTNCKTLWRFSIHEMLLFGVGHGEGPSGSVLEENYAVSGLHWICWGWGFIQECASTPFYIRSTNIFEKLTIDIDTEKRRHQVKKLCVQHKNPGAFVRIWPLIFANGASDVTDGVSPSGCASACLAGLRHHGDSPRGCDDGCLTEDSLPSKVAVIVRF